MTRRLVCVFVSLTLSAAAASQAADLPESWPEGWREGYARFEKFLETRRKDWPVSQLEIMPDGLVATGFQLDAQRESALSLQIFQDGIGNLSAGVDENGRPSHLEIFQALTPRRLNAGVVLVTTVLGYQHILPIVWFEIIPEAGAEKTLFGGTERRLKIIPAPEPAEDYLPNDRYLQWLDFQVIPRHFPHDVREANRKVTPAVFLQVDRAGVVHRKPLDDPKAESALEWHLYYNGRLKDRSSARNVLKLQTAQYGPGNYVVLAGVSGPDGFLPVSNLLQFNLAPGSNRDRLELLFSTFDYGQTEDYPDWYREILPTGKRTFFESEDKLQQARNLAVAWRGCSDLYNSPSSKWIVDGEKSD